MKAKTKLILNSTLLLALSVAVAVYFFVEEPQWVLFEVLEVPGWIWRVCSGGVVLYLLGNLILVLQGKRVPTEEVKFLEKMTPKDRIKRLLTAVGLGIFAVVIYSTCTSFVFFFVIPVPYWALAGILAVFSVKNFIGVFAREKAFDASPKKGKAPVQAQPKPQPKPAPAAPKKDPPVTASQPDTRTAEELYREALPYKFMGPKQDLPKAFRLLLQAARKGHDKAQFEVGYAYNCGFGVPVSYSQAFSWYMRSARQGNRDAMRNVGLCFRDGQGITADATMARYWLKKAADQGNTRAAEDLKELNM